jgi:hypothetical protein
MAARDLLLAAGGFSYFVALLQLTMLRKLLTGLSQTSSASGVVVTLLLAAVFGVFALYALSGARIARPLPYLRAALLSIGFFYILPVVCVFAEIVASARVPACLTPRNAVLTLVSLIIGVLYLSGTIASWPVLKQSNAAGRQPVVRIP